MVTQPERPQPTAGHQRKGSSTWASGQRQPRFLDAGRSRRPRTEPGGKRDCVDAQGFVVAVDPGSRMVLRPIRDRNRSSDRTLAHVSNGPAADQKPPRPPAWQPRITAGYPSSPPPADHGRRHLPEALRPQSPATYLRHNGRGLRSDLTRAFTALGPPNSRRFCLNRVGQTTTRFRPIYLKHASKQAVPCLRLDGNGRPTAVNRPADGSGSGTRAVVSSRDAAGFGGCADAYERRSDCVAASSWLDGPGFRLVDC